jgi:hypothetical protein
MHTHGLCQFLDVIAVQAVFKREQGLCSTLLMEKGEVLVESRLPFIESRAHGPPLSRR